jgi:hypothetical protein
MPANDDDVPKSALVGRSKSVADECPPKVASIDLGETGL